MRKLIVFNMVSLDGYFARSDGSIDWHTVDDAFNDYAISSLENIDTIIFGRTTYQLFEEYWPHALTDPATDAADLKIAQFIHDATKIVFSRSLQEVVWNNSRLEPELTPEHITELKNQPGKDIIIYGSGHIVRQLMDVGLIDEYRLMVAPLILGQGMSLFEGVKQTKLALASAQPIGTAGNVLLTYTHQ